MDEKMKEHTCEHPEGCRCMACQMGMGGGMMGHGMCGCGCGRHGGRWVVRIIVLLIIFWFGVQWGEMRVLSGYGRGMMGGWGYERNYMMGSDYGAPGTEYANPGTQVVPSATAPSSATQ